VMDRLGEITIPTLLVGGRFDECRPSHLAEMHRRIPGSRLAIIRTPRTSASPSSRRNSWPWPAHSCTRRSTPSSRYPGDRRSGGERAVEPPYVQEKRSFDF
jgi:hypothetical protein